MKLSKPQSIIIFALFVVLLIGFFVWQQSKKPVDQNTNQDTTPEQRDQLVQDLLQTSPDEDKFCMTIDDCVIVSSGGECPQQAAFYKDAIDAHRAFIENATSSTCQVQGPKGTAQLACQDHQCQIEYSE